MSEAVEAVRAVLALPEEELDYARAKLAFDRIIDPSTDEEAMHAELERMAETARGMAGAGAGDDARLLELRRVIYKGGPWNGHRPFVYDHRGFKTLSCKLLSNYFKTRFGNCVSMPVLFVVMAEKLGLDVGHPVAPQHFFVKYRPEGGPEFNLEATGAARPRTMHGTGKPLRLSDVAVASGLYLRR